MKFARFAVVLAVSTAAIAQVPAAPEPTPELLARGRKIFGAYCATCHGVTGAGDGPAGKVLTPRPRDFRTEPFRQGDSVLEVFATVTKGVPGTAMVAFPHLAEADRWAVAHHVAALRRAGAPARGAAPPAPR